MIMRKPARTIAWSSASNTRIGSRRGASSVVVSVTVVRFRSAVRRLAVSIGRRRRDRRQMFLRGLRLVRASRWSRSPCRWSGRWSRSLSGRWHLACRPGLSSTSTNVCAAVRPSVRLQSVERNSRSTASTRRWSSIDAAIPSLVKIWVPCDSTVRSLMKSSLAMPAFERP